MSTIVFNSAAMLADVEAFANAAKGFLEPASVKTLEGLATTLEQRLATARAHHESRSFPWGTPEETPVRTEPSDSWKGAGEIAHKKLQVELQIDWKCLIDHSGKNVVVGEGSVDVQVFHAGEDNAHGRKRVHYDIDRGRTGKGAGHPPVHVQFDSTTNDIPRSPTYLAHPLDVLDFFLFELFQRKWRDHVSTAARQKLKTFPAIQRQRFSEYLRLQHTIVANSREMAPVVALQRPLPKSFDLYRPTSGRNVIVRCSHCQKTATYPYLSDSKTRPWHSECASFVLTRVRRKAGKQDDASCPRCGHEVALDELFLDKAKPPRRWHDVSRSCVSAALGELRVSAGS